MGETMMVYVKGKRFACECGCNVFQREGSLYHCNACGCVYEGTRENEPEGNAGRIRG